MNQIKDKQFQKEKISDKNDKNEKNNLKVKLKEKCGKKNEILKEKIMQSNSIIFTEEEIQKEKKIVFIADNHYIKVQIFSIFWKNMLLLF